MYVIVYIFNLNLYSYLFLTFNIWDAAVQLQISLDLIILLKSQGNDNRVAFGAGYAMV